MVESDRNYLARVRYWLEGTRAVSPDTVPAPMAVGMVDRLISIIERQEAQDGTAKPPLPVPSLVAVPSPPATIQATAKPQSYDRTDVAHFLLARKRWWRARMEAYTHPDAKRDALIVSSELHALACVFLRSKPTSYTRQDVADILRSAASRWRTRQGKRTTEQGQYLARIRADELELIARKLLNGTGLEIVE